MKELHVTVQVRNNRLRQRREELGMSQLQLSEAAGVSWGTYQGLETMRESPFKSEPIGGCRFEACCSPVYSHETCLCRAHHFQYRKPAWSRFKAEAELGAKALAELPRKTRTRWRRVVEKLAAFYECEPEELFPDGVLAVKQAKVVRAVDAEEVAFAVMESGRTPMLLPEAAVDGQELRGEVDRLLKGLTKRQEQVLRKRFGIGEESDHTLNEVSQALDVGRERARQIEATALRKLRHPSLSKFLKPFIDA